MSFSFCEAAFAASRGRRRENGIGLLSSVWPEDDPFSNRPALGMYRHRPSDFIDVFIQFNRDRRTEIIYRMYILAKIYAIVQY